MIVWNPSLIDGPLSLPGGYHLNVAPQAMSEAAEPFVIHPATPDRGFAGADTVYLRFDSEAQAMDVLAGLWFEVDPDPAP